MGTFSSELIFGASTSLADTMVWLHPESSNIWTALPSKLSRRRYFLLRSFQATSSQPLAYQNLPAPDVVGALLLGQLNMRCPNFQHWKHLLSPLEFVCMRPSITGALGWKGGLLASARPPWSLLWVGLPPVTCGPLTSLYPEQGRSRPPVPWLVEATLASSL